jgi:hypothetical protein
MAKGEDHGEVRRRCGSMLEAHGVKTLEGSPEALFGC